MPVEFTIDAQNRLVRSRSWAALRGTELIDHLEAMKRLFADGTLDGSWAQVIDFSDVDSYVEVSTAIVRRMADENPWPAESVRIVVAPNDVSYGLARMYQLLGAESAANVHIVRSIDEANAWFARRRGDSAGGS